MTNRNRVNDIFKERYKQMPSTLYIKNEKISKENLDKFLSNFLFLNNFRDIPDMLV